MHPIAEALCIIIGLIIAVIACVDAWIYHKHESDRENSIRKTKTISFERRSVTHDGE
ncbi:MAG: hypothetical protein WDA65_09540 [Christensenellales bacterium]